MLQGALQKFCRLDLHVHKKKQVIPDRFQNAQQHSLTLSVLCPVTVFHPFAITIGCTNSKGLFQIWHPYLTLNNCPEMVGAFNILQSIVSGCLSLKVHVQPPPPQHSRSPEAPRPADRCSLQFDSEGEYLINLLGWWARKPSTQQQTASCHQDGQSNEISFNLSGRKC